jgi:predicted protein tyrosine phosphatase
MVSYDIVSAFLALSYHCPLVFSLVSSYRHLCEKSNEKEKRCKRSMKRSLADVPLCSEIPNDYKIMQRRLVGFLTPLIKSQ